MQLESFTTFNLAILVLALGSWLNSRIGILRDFNIPEPVTSGLLVCVVTALLYWFVGLEISFSLATRDFLLLYFFASIGLNSDIKTLWAGGIPLLILVAVTIGFMLLQNLTGIAVATSLGLDALGRLARRLRFVARRPRHQHRVGSDICGKTRNPQRDRDWYRLRDARLGDLFSDRRSDRAVPDHSAWLGAKGHPSAGRWRHL